MKKVQPKVKKIVNRSIEEAKLYADVEIKLEHIMIALINDYDNQAIKFLEELKINVDDLHRKVEINLINNDESSEVNNTLLPMTEYAKKIIKEAETASGATLPVHENGI